MDDLRAEARHLPRDLPEGAPVRPERDLAAESGDLDQVEPRVARHGSRALGWLHAVARNAGRLEMPRIGAEGNGGVILPELHLGRDAPVAVALTLQYLMEFGGTMQELHASLPQYAMVKQKVNIEGMDPDKVLEKIVDKYKDYEINLLDGLKIDIKNSWIHLRKSNTEPIVRIISEAPTLEEAEKLGQKFMAEIKSLI